MVGPEDQTSSMYSTITRDSQMGLPSWIRTGIFLWTGFDSRRSWLLDPSFSSRNSYPRDLILRAILALITKGLGHAPISFTSLLAMIDNIKPNKVLRVCVCLNIIYMERMTMEDVFIWNWCGVWKYIAALRVVGTHGCAVLAFMRRRFLFTQYICLTLQCSHWEWMAKMKLFSGGEAHHVVIWHLPSGRWRKVVNFVLVGVLFFQLK